jgi:pyridoxal phosphate enzyme (YggS family)
MSEAIKERLAQVLERIITAAERVGRNPQEVTLVAVSKTFDAETVQQAVDAGVRVLGENKVQEAVEKSQLVKAEGLRWHLIGHLQSNKVRHAARTFDMIHTVDSAELAQRLDRIAGEEGRRIEVLIQVDLAHEAAKSGADETEVPAIIETLDRATHLQLRGLMVMPPFFEDAELTRPYFKRLRNILDAVNVGRPDEKRLTELSMGMSHDFEVAIEEGATLVRVGSAIFGERGYRQI